MILDKYYFMVKNAVKPNTIIYKLFRFVWRHLARLFIFNPRNRLFNKHSLDVLMSAKIALDSCNAIFWLDSGTLLGVIREGKMLKNDLDIDLGLWLSDYSSNIDKAMTKNGFIKMSEVSINDKKVGLEQTYIKDGVTVDLFYFDKNNSLMWSHVFVKGSEMPQIKNISGNDALVPIRMYYPLSGFTNIKFQGGNYLIPDPPDKYLEFHYGKDYLTPRKWAYYDLINDNINAEYLYNQKIVTKRYL